MSPELRTLIYGTIAAVVLAILSAATKFVFDRLSKAKPSAVDRGQAVADLAEAMVDVSTKAVTGVREQLVAAVADLKIARLELVDTKRRMEERERTHVAATGKLRARIAQLVKVLEDNDFPVPDEVDDPASVPA